MADNDSDKEMAASKQGAYGDSNSNSAEDDWLDTRYLPTPPNIPPARPARGCPHTSRSNERNDRNNRNDRNDSNDLPTASGVVSLPPGSRGPRSLYLRRDGDNFGFTLRHFIVYPPDSVAASDGRHAAVGALRTPMETIFVKQVYEDSPAHKAGLNHGDRIISVNGHSLNGKKYSQVVQLIQSSPSYLHLLVVPKEDDVLQKFFPETAHNPETNQRPQRFASPEHFSPRRNQHQLNEHLNYRPIVYPSTSHQNRPSADVVSCWSHEEPIYSEYRNAHYQQIRAPNSTGNIQNIQYRDNSSRSSDQVYSLPRDQIVYRASPNTRPQYGRNSLRDSDSIETTHIYSEPYVHDLSQRPRAQPQVPLYRKMGRRASDGNNISDNNSRTYDECRDCTSIGSSVDMVVNSSKMKSASKVTYHQLNPAHMAAADAQSQTSYSSPESVVPCGLQGLSYVNSAGCRLSLDAGRRESTASLNSSVANGSKDSLSSYESGSTVTGDTDDSIIMSRFRKSFEKKEEFLRRPSQPFTWKIPEETPPSANVKTIPSVIQREFYGRPQKLQKEWPPMEPLNNDQESPSKTPKPTNQNLQRVRIDIDTERDCSGAGATSNTTADGEKESPRNHMQAARNKFYEGATTGIEQTTQFVVGGMVSQRNTNVRQSKDKSLFVTTLSRIHESGPSTSDNYDDGMNGASLPYDLLDERRYPVPPNLQIVSRRTRQFESGRPLPEEEDGSLSDRTNLYRSELARLSSKCVVPNVQVRKREFETLEIENNKDYRRDRDTARRSTQRESRSLDNSDISSFDNEGAQVRVRSNSAESWSAIPGSSKDWPAQPVVTDEKYRANKIGRQDSYVSALQSKVPDQDHNTQSVFVEQEEMDIGPQTSPPGTIVPNLLNHHYPKPIYNQNRMPVVSITPSNNTQKPVIIRPNQLTIASPMRPATAATTNLVAINTNNALHNTFGDVSATMLSASPVPGDEPPQVMRRTKNNTNTVGDEERATRRVSYLKATWGDRMHVESDLDLSDNEVQPQILRNRSGSAEGSGPLSLDRSDTPTSSDREAAPIIRDGALSCKFMELEGKRAHDRSWHKVWAVLKGPHLILYKDRHHHHPSPMGLVDTEQQLPGGVDMRYSIVNVADDYTKRKNVLRISAASPYRTELLLQADSPYEMADWVRTLQEQSGASIDEDKQEYMSENKQAQPQQVPAATSIQVQGVARLSPQPSNKSKLTTFRNRSPTGQSPKSKTWRGRVVKQFKKLNQGSGSPSSPTTPEKLTFGVPLELCQRALHTEFVPRFVEMCTEIIEERGLEVTGIYRVPGNNAAVSALTDELNKGINLAFQDVRSSDTNVVSSLLKSFFRKLPDSLLTSELYGHFIEADKIDDARTRLYEIKKLLNELPDFQYATLKYLILHLKKVVDKSSVNKMEARNLAIVFGPTLVRNVEDNMVTMVTDMSHQCRIVESLLLYPDWFFSEEDTELLILHQNTVQEVASQEIDNASASVNNTLLLGNISKIEGIKTESSTREKKDIMSSIISAANRKIQRKSRKTTTDNNSSSSSSHSQAHTKEETVTPASEPKETNIVPHLPEPEHEQKQISLESEESSNSDNIIPDDPLLMTYPQLEAKTSERIEKFKQETMAMLHQQKRRSDPSRSFMKPYHQNGHQAAESTENPTSSDLLATITSEFDNKIKAFLQSPTNNSLTIADNIPYADESPDVTLNSFDLPIVEGAKMFSKCKESQNCDQDADKMSPKSFRNPSLHKNFNTSLNISSNNSLSNNLNKSQQQQQNAELLKNFMCKNSSYEADKEKDIDENENNPEEAKTDNDQQSNGDEVNDLCKVNYTNFLMNKELKCSSSDSKLKRSESLNKSNNYDSEQEHGKLKRSVSLNRAADRLKRSDSLTKYEKTESNINLRREMADDRRLKKVSTKLKRKNGMPERSIKRRHTVGGTKDFDRVHWLDNRLRYEAEETATNEEKENKAMRSSSPDLSSSERIRDNNDESKILPLESHI